MLLAIDTATRTASIALYHEAGVLAETTWRSKMNHTVELMPQITRLLNLAQIRKNDLRAIGVVLGPGSFTGLRVGMSVAKGLAFGCRIPLIGVPTLDAVAAPHAWQTLPILAVLAAGRGRYSIARYHATNGTTQRTSEYALVNADALIARDEFKQSNATLVCGDIDPALTKRLHTELGAHVVVPSPAMNERRAAFLAELAWARFQRGESDDATSLAPIYLPHESVEGSAIVR